MCIGESFLFVQRYCYDKLLRIWKLQRRDSQGQQFSRISLISDVSLYKVLNSNLIILIISKENRC